MTLPALETARLRLRWLTDAERQRYLMNGEVQDPMMYGFLSSEWRAA